MCDCYKKVKFPNTNPETDLVLAQLNRLLMDCVGDEKGGIDLEKCDKCCNGKTFIYHCPEGHWQRIGRYAEMIGLVHCL